MNPVQARPLLQFIVWFAVASGIGFFSFVLITFFGLICGGNKNKFIFVAVWVFHEVLGASAYVICLPVMLSALVLLIGPAYLDTLTNKKNKIPFWQHYYTLLSTVALACNLSFFIFAINGFVGYAPSVKPYVMLGLVWGFLCGSSAFSVLYWMIKSVEPRPRLARPLEEGELQ